MENSKKSTFIPSGMVSIDGDLYYKKDLITPDGLVLPEKYKGRGVTLKTNLTRSNASVQDVWGSWKQ